MCPDREEILIVDQIGKSLAGKQVLSEISFTLARGTCAAILGESGSGKTTLLKIIAGFILPDRGDIRTDMRILSRPTGAVIPEQRLMSMVFQGSALWPHLNVYENITFGVRRGLNKKKIAYENAEALGIGPLLKRMPSQISGGEARRVALARALAAQPNWLLMDEPFTNLDEELKDRAISWVKHRMESERIGIILVTHEIREAEQLADKTYEVKGGRLAEVDCKWPV